MKFEITEEDLPFIPTAIAAVAATIILGAVVIHAEIKERKNRTLIQKIRDEALTKIRQERETLIKNAEANHRKRMDDVLNPLREKGLID